MKQIINKIKLKLNGPLPGEEAHFVMAPVNRQNYDVNKLQTQGFKQSAVMLLICEDENGNLFIPLTQRFTYDGVHSGQVSLPGGKFDETDLDLRGTALRECFEEIGIVPSAIEILGELTPLYIPVSKFFVQPIVGLCNIKNSSFNNHEREVKTVINFFVNDLLKNETVKIGDIEIRSGEKLKAPYFEVEGTMVWGATAMILNEFKAILLP